MNMILQDYATTEIKQGNTLANPLFSGVYIDEIFDQVMEGFLQRKD
jgi:hypothetical protein